MSNKIQTIRRFHQEFKSFRYTDMTPVASSEYLEAVTEVDQNGNITIESKFDMDGELEERNTYTYDQLGKMTEHILYFAIDDVYEKRVLIRDDKGNALSETKYYGGEAGEKTEYEYATDGKIVGVRYYDEEGDFFQHEVLTYNEKRNPLERITYNKDDKKIQHITFLSDDQYKIIDEEYDAKGALLSRTEIQLNENGKESKSFQTNAQGKVIASVENIYDDRGNVIRRVHKDFHPKTVKFVYDEQDRLIEQELFDGNGTLLRKNLYDYDDDGNMMSEQTYEIDSSRGGKDKHYALRYEYLLSV